MLEVKNLTKIYQSKNGVETRALDDVTLRFPERGMVFLLGKSGSGKSTLLNVCGGLDSPTDGEVIVKGRSSKKFSQSDFDSYRNTYVGFIFQEYNILNEFTVEDNIALALELQGKPKDKKAIGELLEQVDLSGFAKRKPNTLSGGQKQRIAIARALVKSPEIIMADEPTGALDSATGKQVFDTLKKLSEDKLVIVVSHDREFAELYADRIIELKDGKIFSDVTKTAHKQTPLSENIDVVGDVLCIKQGAKLDDAEFEKIKKFLGNAESDVIIAGGTRDVSNFKKVSRITDDGAKEVFDDTDESTVPMREYTKEESRFIRSKLPLKHAARIGISGLKTKPVRLFFTILLCVVAFTLFGLLSTLSFYDSEATFKQTLRDSNADYITIGEQYKVQVVSYENGAKSYEYENVYDAQFSESSLSQLREEYGDSLFGASSVRMSLTPYANSPYWIAEVRGAAYLPEGHVLRSRLSGKYPIAADEICISSYLANMLCECGYADASGKKVDVARVEDLIGKTISVNGTKYKVVGIIDSGEVNPKYETLKNNDNTNNNSLVYTYELEMADGLHLLAFFSKEGMQSVAGQYGNNYSGENNIYDRRGQLIYVEREGEMKEESSYTGVYYSSLSSLDKSAYLSLSVNTDGIVISSQKYVDILQEQSGAYREELEKERDALYEEGVYDGEDIDDLNEKIAELEEFDTLLRSITDGMRYEMDADGNQQMVSATKEERMADLVRAYTLAQALQFDSSYEAKFALYNDRSMAFLTDFESYPVIGVFLPDEPYGMESETVYLPDAKVSQYWETQKQTLEYYSEESTAYKVDPNGMYSTLYLPLQESDEIVDRLWGIYQNKEYDENDARLVIKDSRVEQIAMVDETVESMAKVFLYVGLAFAVFAILLFANFISVSISQKRKEIGILRAVGARSFDVFKIFFSESFTIAAVCTVFSVIASAALCRVLNTTLGETLGASLFVFGFASIAILIGIAILTAIIATFLPVWKAAKKKPVDSIRAL